MVLIILGAAFIGYDILLLAVHPSTFWDCVFSFTHVWLAAGAYLVFAGIYRIKKGHSVWSAIKKPWKIVTGILCGLCCTVACVNLAFILTPDISKADEEDADYVILLGGGIDKYGRLTPAVNKRVEKAAEYLNHHEKSLCVVSGGAARWTPFPEAPAMKEYLVKLGVGEDRILVEDQALDTIQNLQNSAKLLAKEEGCSAGEILGSKVVIVTTHFHMARALRLAGRLGYSNVKGVASSMTLYNLPNAYAREICSYIKLNMRILFTGAPSRICE